MKFRVVNCFFCENLNYTQTGNGYLDSDLGVRKANGNNFVVAVDNTIERVVLVNNAFAFTIQYARITTSSRIEIEQTKFVGPVSTNMMFLTQRPGDLSTYFDIIDESEDGNYISTLKQALINNDTEGNRGLIRGHLPQIFISAFC